MNTDAEHKITLEELLQALVQAEIRGYDDLSLTFRPDGSGQLEFTQAYPCPEPSCGCEDYTRARWEFNNLQELEQLLKVTQ